jgi:hypothetical protein
MPSDPVLDWLLEGDPSIRWQALRDLAGAPERTWQREQRKVATAGWGSQLLALQDADGRWASCVYSPKWTSTTYTLLLLRDLGLPAGNRQAVRACRLLLDEGFAPDDGINFWQKRSRHSETCVTAMVLSICRTFGLTDPRLERLAHHLLAAQMADGGWNCQAAPGRSGATHGSFHTTIQTLEALAGLPAAARASARAEEFLLLHGLFRSHRTGGIAKSDFTRLHFPPRWHHDILRGLDYFRARDHYDPRLEDALNILQSRRRKDGRWPPAQAYSGRIFFALEPPREPSRNITLRALRILRWAKRGEPDFHAFHEQD